jgi:hypothetical protein
LVVLAVSHGQNREILSTRWYMREGSAAIQLREFLAEYRREGLTFWRAWPLAMSRISFTSARDQADWLRAWREPEIFSAWMAAYDGEPHFGAASVGQLAGLHELVAYPDAAANETHGPQHYSAPRISRHGEAA